MEILINELSLHGQYATLDDFTNIAVKPLLSLLQQFDPERDIILKKYDLYSAHITPTTSLHQVFTGSYSRTCDEIRRSKSQLAALMDKPYWEDDRKHKKPDAYWYNATDIYDSSLAESCERDKVVISFVSGLFNSTELLVNKNSINIRIDNLIDHTHLYALVRTRRLMVVFSLSDTSRFKKTHFNVQGKVIYKELSTKYYWYLDNLHRSHYEVFNQNHEHIGIADKTGNIDFSQMKVGRTLFD